MNADAFRTLYDYHMAMNRKLWDTYILPLSQDLFVQPVAYSVGSIRDQCVHLINADEVWFTGLRGLVPTPWRDPSDYADRDKIRAEWDAVEKQVRAYLAALDDATLLTKPFAEDEDKDLMVWQVLLHVANHGTDHRAQILRLLHDVGVDTGPQDLIFHIYNKL